MTTLDDDLAALGQDALARVRAAGVDLAQVAAWGRALAGGRTDGRVQGRVEALAEGDLDEPPVGDEAAACEALGRDALARGEVAFVVLAGGMATRMGGVVKALVHAAAGKTFLELRLAERAAAARRAGCPYPLWLMTSHATDAPVRDALANAQADDGVATFVQGASLRLEPSGRLFLDEHGAPSLFATGHGDLPDALAASGLLARFVERGGRALLVANLDNLGASIDPLLLGAHLARGSEVTVEVVDKRGTDRGGIPVRLDGRPVVLEEFRLPRGFDPATVRVFNTNTFWIDARALARSRPSFTWLEVEKHALGRVAVQHERLLGELTATLATRLLRVPRDGVASRFVPVKDAAELEARRPELEALARSRGMLGEA